MKQLVIVSNHTQLQVKTKVQFLPTRIKHSEESMTPGE